LSLIFWIPRPEAFTLKTPSPRDASHAEDPFLIGRELISQGSDWPNEKRGVFRGSGRRV